MSTELASLNVSQWPFVYVKFHNIPINDLIFENYTKNYLQLLIKCKKNKEKIYVIIDINEFESLPIPYLLKQAQFNKKIFKYNQRHLHCAYIYCKNKVFKKIIKTFMMIEKPAVPLRIVRSLTKLNKSIFDNYNIHFDSNNFFNDNLIENSEQNNEENKENDDSEVDFSKLLANINDLDLINKSQTNEFSVYNNEFNILEE